MQRRIVVKQLSVLLPASLAGRLALAQSSELKEGDAEALAVEYRADATKVDPAKSPKYKRGQSCRNCGLFVPEAGSPLGGCQLFLGKDVAATGWCNAWEAKA